MTDPWPSKAADALLGQVNARWPDRDTASDGWVGDLTHQARQSDHNPDPDTGVVRARDFDSDLTPHRNGTDPMQTLADQLIRCARRGEDRRRLSYVIYRGRIASGTFRDTFWTWRPYIGTDPHINHLHVSFTPRGDTDPRPFPLAVFTGPERRRLRRTINRLRARIAAARSRLEALK